MKRLLPFLIMLCASCVMEAKDLCFEQQCFFATVNDTPFVFREYWPISSSLIRQQGSMDGRAPQRTIISVFLSGASYPDKNGKQFNESIQFEILYEEGKTGEPELYTTSLHYQSELYSVVRQKGSLVISDFKYEPDKQAFRISLRFNCVMHSWSAAYENKEDVLLKGEISNVLVQVPGWLLSKN